MYNRKYLTFYTYFVDVRDVAKAVVEVLKRPGTEGQRFLLIEDEPHHMNDVVPIAETLFPQYELSIKPFLSPVKFWIVKNFFRVPFVGNLALKPAQLIVLSHPTLASNQKSKEVLEIDYSSDFTKMIEDTFKSMEKYILLNRIVKKESIYCE